MRTRQPYRGADHFTKAAKQGGFPARSVFKLEEIDRRLSLLRAGMRVLDLGASPGSWSLYTAQKIGLSGRLLAVDQKPLTVALPPPARFVLGDAFALDTEMTEAAPYDVVLSDMAPYTSGDSQGDHLRSAELFLRALSIARTVLKPHGAFVGKLFMGGELPAVRASLRSAFRKERILRPEGIRKNSCEIFLVGLDRREEES